MIFPAYLYDILQACYAIQKTAGALTLATFHEHSDAQAAIERRFEIIGEALRQSRTHFPGETERLGAVQPIIDFRNFLAHQYNEVSPTVVWAIIVRDLQPLLVKTETELLLTGEALPSR